MATAGTKKPFSYCPGGINFNELKSPAMARRIAKHQENLMKPAPQPQLLPSAPSPVNQVMVSINLYMNTCVTVSSLARSNSLRPEGHQHRDTAQ